MSQDFVRLLLVLVGIAVGLGLVIAAFVYAGGTRGGKRYRPGRPFTFMPVWFLAAPQRQIRAVGKELAIVSGRAASRPRETGGASDRW